MLRRIDWPKHCICEMPRQARIVLEGCAHHVVSRGVNRRSIFRSGYDKRRYLKRFARIAEDEGVQVHAYCLMDNHVHWILTPATPDGLARLFHRLHTWWAMDFNRRNQRCGHLFQNRYHSTPLGENHYWAAMRYVELNPRRAGCREELAEWEHSSARAHLEGRDDALVPLAWGTWRERRQTPESWREYLGETDREAEERLRRAIAGSRPCGDEEWVRGLEAKHGRKLAWSPPGRPRTAATREAAAPAVL